MHNHKRHEDNETIIEEMKEHEALVGHKLRFPDNEEIVSHGAISHKRVSHPKLTVSKFHPRV